MRFYRSYSERGKILQELQLVRLSDTPAYLNGTCSKFKKVLWKRSYWWLLYRNKLYFKLILFKMSPVNLFQFVQANKREVTNGATNVIDSHNCVLHNTVNT